MTKATALALSLFAATAHAQTVPSGREVFVRSLKVTGADTVLPKHKTLKMSGSFTTTGTFMGAITITRTSNGEYRRVMDVENYGLIEFGYANGTGYSLNAKTDPMLLSGAELAQAKDLGIWLDTPDNYISISNQGAVKFDGKDAYKLELLSKDSVKSTRFYDVSSGLPLGSATRKETDEGLIEAQLIFSDYKNAGGMLIPAKMQHVGGAGQTVTFSKIEWDTAVSADYALPAEVVAMKGGK